MTLILNNIYPMNLHEYNIHQKLTWIQRKFSELSNNGLPGTLEEKLKTQLLWLINEYDYEEVEILIGIGTSFSKKDLDETLDHFLMHVVKNGNLMVARKLLEAGANVNYDDYSDYPSDTPLLKAIEQDNFKMVQLLLEYDADVNSPNNADHYPLTEAVYEGNLNIIKLLLEYGADPHLKNGADMTALMIAIENGDMEIIKLLLRFGAKLD